jgi:hypothetical protein
MFKLQSTSFFCIAFHSNISIIQINIFVDSVHLFDIAQFKAFITIASFFATFIFTLQSSLIDWMLSFGIFMLQSKLSIFLNSFLKEIGLQLGFAVSHFSNIFRVHQ